MTTTACPTAAIFAAPLSLPLSALQSAVNPAHVEPAVTKSGGEVTLTAVGEPAVRGRAAGASAITAASEAATSSAGGRAGEEAARKMLEDTRSGDLLLSDPRSARLGSDSKSAIGADAEGVVKTATAAAVRGMEDRGMKDDEEEEDDDDETVVGALEMSTGTDYAASLGKIGKERRTKSSAEDEMALRTASVGEKLVAPTVGYMRKSLSEKVFRGVS